MTATSARLVGLNMCLPRTRTANLLATAIAGAASTSSGEWVRRSRQSERPEMRALLGSKAGRRQIRVHASWVASAAARIANTRPGPISNSSRTIP